MRCRQRTWVSALPIAILPLLLLLPHRGWQHGAGTAAIAATAAAAAVVAAAAAWVRSVGRLLPPIRLRLRLLVLWLLVRKAPGLSPPLLLLLLLGRLAGGKVLRHLCAVGGGAAVRRLLAGVARRCNGIVRRVKNLFGRQGRELRPAARLRGSKNRKRSSVGRVA